MGVRRGRRGRWRCGGAQQVQELRGITIDLDESSAREMCLGVCPDGDCFSGGYGWSITWGNVCSLMLSARSTYIARKLRSLLMVPFGESHFSKYISNQFGVCTVINFVNKNLESGPVGFALGRDNGSTCMLDYHSNREVKTHAFLTISGEDGNSTEVAQGMIPEDSSSTCQEGCG